MVKSRQELKHISFNQVKNIIEQATSSREWILILFPYQYKNGEQIYRMKLQIPNGGDYRLAACHYSLAALINNFRKATKDEFVFVVANVTPTAWQYSYRLLMGTNEIPLSYHIALQNIKELRKVCVFQFGECNSSEKVIPKWFEGIIPFDNVYYIDLTEEEKKTMNYKLDPNWMYENK